MVIVDLYEWSIWPWIIANGVVAAWALVAHLQDRYQHRALWVSAGVQAIIALHVLFGAIAQAQDEIEPGEPLLYGLAAFMSCESFSVPQRDAGPDPFAVRPRESVADGARDSGRLSRALVPRMIGIDDFLLFTRRTVTGMLAAVDRIGDERISGGLSCPACRPRSSSSRTRSQPPSFGVRTSCVVVRPSGSVTRNSWCRAPSPSYTPPRRPCSPCSTNLARNWRRRPNSLTNRRHRRRSRLRGRSAPR